MTASFDDELSQHAGALRGLARALVGARDADDVVQDVALAALQRPPGRSGSMFGWLAAVLRHRAQKHRRGERRRVVREQRVAARVSEAESPSPLGAASHREMVARLDAALLGLPQPYQDTLLLRYFEDLTPSEIAARTGEPLATVKSRLQRGLAMLRQRLDSDRGDGDWRAGLVATFGLGKQAAAAAMIVGIALMTTKIVLGAAAAVFAGILLWPRGEAPIAAPAVAANESRAVAAMATESAASPLASDREAVSADVEPMPIAAASVGATFSGRCIDESGAPLPDVRIEARTIVRKGGKVLAGSDLSTTADGAFTVELPIVDGAAHRIELRAEGRCTLRGQVNDVQPGERHELGDVVMPMVRSLRGRIVDDAGAPQVGVRVLLSRDRAGGPASALVDVFLATQMTATTDDLGGFALDEELPGGSYWLQLGNRLLVDASDSKVTLAGPQRERVLELVVEPAPTPCRGVVLRADGSSVAGAHVSLDGNAMDTGADGRFELLPKPDWGRGERRLEVSADGFIPDRAHTWRFGDADLVRVLLRTAPAVTLRVFDGRTGDPVVRYAARLVYPNTWSSGNHVVPPGEHANGISRIVALPGSYFVIVTPESPELLRSTFHRVELPESRDAEVAVALWPPLERRLVVTDGRAPVAGVAVQLLDPGDVKVRCDTETWALEDCRVNGPPLARIVQQGETAADGSIVLRGPKGPLALRLSGAGLALQIVQPVSLDAAGDLTVSVPRGATWRGRLVPTEVAGELFALGQPRPNAEPAKVGIDLVRDDGESLHRFLEKPFPFAADGGFEIDGIPPGTWHAVVKGKSSYAAATITIAEGQALERDLDVSAFAAADVTLHVLVDGAPAKDSYVNATGRHAKDVFGQRFGSQTMGRTDADGRFVLRTFVGDLEVHVYWRSGSGKESIVRAYAVVPRAGEQELVLDLRLGALDVLLLRPDGTPATGVQLREAGRRAGFSWTADDEGRVRVQPIAAGSYVLEARPRSLSTSEARDAFAQLHGWQALEREWVPCGVVTVATGAAVPQRLQLPAAWDR